jgi:hypothetical protein
MIKEFPYIREKGRYLPMVPVVVGSLFQTYAIIDSGAEISLFRPEVGKILGIQIEKGQKMELTGIGGRIVIYKHVVSIAVADWKLKCLIAFSHEFMASVNILGRNNFFHHFIVKFDELRKLTYLEDRGL